MKKTNHFEKFLPKKKNSAIKEEFRQQKRKEKKARAEAIEQRKAAKRLELKAQRPPDEKRRGQGEGHRTKAQDPGYKTTGARNQTDAAGPKSVRTGFKKEASGPKATGAKFRSDTTASKPSASGFRKDDSGYKEAGAKFKRDAAGSKSATTGFKKEISGPKATGTKFKTNAAASKPSASIFRKDDEGYKAAGAKFKADADRPKSEGKGFKKEVSGPKATGTKFKSDATASKPSVSTFRKDDSGYKAAGARIKAEPIGKGSSGPRFQSARPASKTSDQRNQPAAAGPNVESASLKPKAISKKAKEEMPLNKYIAHCGICSRRDAAELVKEGKIKVNGIVITEPGFKVTADDEVFMSNKKIYLAHNLVYILLNKPKDYITTADDPQGRKTVLELVRGATSERIFPIGRLDRNTTGVLLLTNDGELTQKLSHPSYEVRKMYEVKLDKPLTKVDFDKILKGVVLEDGPVQVDALAYADTKDKSVIGIELHSGRNRIVRRIFEALGYDVRNLDRVMFANLTKKNVERGKWRFLKDKEVRLLKFMNSSFIRKQKKSAV